ncbi:hypothetical protein BJV77DRAFT_740606 [Russula vinacea]|nr:hypothetical protein BJV77DRAFT_740606 [Russula vinacea]
MAVNFNHGRIHASPSGYSCLSPLGPERRKLHISSMFQTSHQDLEGEDDPGGQRTQRDNSPSNPQPAPNQQLQAESIFGDSSGPLFSIYSKAAEEEDNKMVERWQKDADGILIFTGLFSAAVAALLAVTVQDLRPNSQDTSAFYLGNIYQVLADPNVTLSSVPTPVATPPPFSRPRYAVWVNSLWFLSLVMSLGCALWATSLHQWARRYIRLTQPARCSPEKRARIRALFANGVEEMHVPWAVEGLPTLLHLSLFLFFGGLAIFLFNVDHDVFTPYNTPLSIIAWFLYARMQYLALKFLVLYRDIFHRHTHRLWRYGMERRLDSWKSESVEKKAEESAEEQSPKIDVRILGWTISALGDDDSLEKFFEAIPGFLNSRLVDLKIDFPLSLLETL